MTTELFFSFFLFYNKFGLSFFFKWFLCLLSACLLSAVFYGCRTVRPLYWTEREGEREATRHRFDRGKLIWTSEFFLPLVERGPFRRLSWNNVRRLRDSAIFLLSGNISDDCLPYRYFLSNLFFRFLIDDRFPVRLAHSGSLLLPVRFNLSTNNTNEKVMIAL